MIKHIVSIVGTYTCCPSTTSILNPGYRRPWRVAFRGLPRPNHVTVGAALNHSRINRIAGVTWQLVLNAGFAYRKRGTLARKCKYRGPWDSDVRMRGFPGLRCRSRSFRPSPNRQAAFGPAPSQPPIYPAGAGLLNTRTTDQAGLRNGEKRQWMVPGGRASATYRWKEVRLR